MTYGWWAVLGVAAAATIWHEVVTHHLIGRLFRRQLVPSSHHSMWAALPGIRRREVHAEMVLAAGLLAAVASLWPLAGLITAAASTLAAAFWSMFRSDRPGI
jgi:hypothetical protein